jgi:hypothetical protein
MLVFIAEFPFWINNILSFGLGILIYIMLVFLCLFIVSEILHVDDNNVEDAAFILFFGFIIAPIVKGCEYFYNYITNYLNHKKLNDFKLAAEYED